MLIRRIQSSGWFSESIMRFEIPWISIVIIQARTSCYLVTHGCLSILSRIQREGQGKNISKRYDNGKIEQNIFARCFVHKYQVLPQTACTWVWNVGAHCHFLCLKPMKQHPKTRERTSLFPHTSLKVNFIITLFFCVCSKPAFFFLLLTLSMCWERPCDLCSRVWQVPPLKYVFCFTRSRHIFYSRENRTICVFLYFLLKTVCQPESRLHLFLLRGAGVFLLEDAGT